MLDLKTATESKVQYHAFTVDDYYKMAEAGILSERDPVELVEGVIIEMPPVGSPHASAVDRLNWHLTRALRPQEALIRIQGPIRLDEYNEPVPDLAVLTWRDDFFSTAHPNPDDVLLLIEVADTSALYDRRIKAPLYAKRAIAKYWLVDVTADHVELYRDPKPDGYASVRIVGRAAEISLLALPDLRLTVDQILG